MPEKLTKGGQHHASEHTTKQHVSELKTKQKYQQKN